MRTLKICLNISNKAEIFINFFWEFCISFHTESRYAFNCSKRRMSAICLTFFWFSFTLETSNLHSFSKYSEVHFLLSRKSFKWTNHFALELGYAMSNWKHIFLRYLGGLSPCFLCLKEFTLSLFFDYLMIALPLLSSMLHWSQLFAKNGI